METNTHLKEEVKKAHTLLSRPSFIIRFSDFVGKPVTSVLNSLPQSTAELIAGAADRALRTCLKGSLLTLKSRSEAPARNWLHKLLCAGTGVIGGVGSVPTLLAEIPLTTGIMLRSIAEIARSEGEDLADPETQLACISVFALEGGNKDDDDADSGFFVSRVAIAKMVRDASKFLSESAAKKISESATAPIVVRFLQQASSRLGVTFSEKAAAQALPIIGSVLGATINTLFIDHYQDIARGHFILRRLERRYSPDLIRKEFESLS